LQRNNIVLQTFITYRQSNAPQKSIATAFAIAGVLVTVGLLQDKHSLYRIFEHEIVKYY